MSYSQPKALKYNSWSCKSQLEYDRPHLLQRQDHELCWFTWLFLKRGLSGDGLPRLPPLTHPSCMNTHHTRTHTHTHTHNLLLPVAQVCVLPLLIHWFQNTTTTMISWSWGEPERACIADVMAYKPWITAGFVTVAVLWVYGKQKLTSCSHFSGQGNHYATHTLGLNFTNCHELNL